MAEAGLTLAEGGSGDDVIRSGGSRDVFIKGGSGNTTLIGGQGNDVLTGGSGHNLIIGGGGKAVIYAGPNGDTIYAAQEGSIIYAGGGEDKIFGGAGDDVIEAGKGNAFIDGDGGTNLVSLHGNHGDYTITRTDSGYVVADNVVDRDGTVTLKNIQKLNFADISAVDLATPGAMPVGDVLTHDKDGEVFSRTKAHLISADSLLANDQRLNSQGELHIASVSDAVGGTATLTSQGDILFVPEAGYTGLLGFKYGVADAAGNLSASVVDLSSGESAPMRATVTLLTPEVPLDPLVAQQWYLSEANILPVWQDYTGKGVRIGQFEPGGQFATEPEIFDITHPDLAANVDQPWLQSQQEKALLPERVSNHATMVAGVMVAAKNNTGGVGVAYDATLGGYYLANDGNDLAGLGHMSSFDIANNSWGFSNDFALDNVQNGAVNTASSLLMNAQYAAANGRGGLGTVMVTAGGNQRAEGGSAQGSLTNNNRFSIEVGAINAQGDLSTLQLGSSPFSSPGASLLVSAPGSNVVSTSHMLTTERGSTFGSDYSAMQGTSFATPIVSGIVALMLEANPNLGYRDVQQILALSAHQIEDPSTQWNDNGSHNWNGGGMHTSNDYGFGEVDARAAVRLAESWTTQNTAANEYVYRAASSQPIGTLTGGSSISSSVAVKSGLNVEHAEIDFDAQVERLGDLKVKLISPGGTESILLDRQGKIPDGMPGANAADRGRDRSGRFTYTFMTTHDFGESSAGDWTLEVVDAESGLPVTLNNWSLRLYGSQSTADDSYFYTDEYTGIPNRNVLDDAVNGIAGGRNTLNAAAVSRDSTVNLLTGIASIGGAALKINNPSGIQNILTGDGDDTLVAGQTDALLDGGRGNNTISGGAGKDFFVVHRRAQGCDTIINFEAERGEVIDLVGFKGQSFADLNISQQGADVIIELEEKQKIILQSKKIDELSAGNFIFQDSFIAPQAYVSSDVSSSPSQEEPGTVILQGGAKGVALSSDEQGMLKFSLAGTVYSHDSASADTFVIAAQSGTSDYKNALRGFRHGVDKIDLRQTSVTDFSQLVITQSNRGTINGLSQIHGVNVAFADGNDVQVKLLYLDTLETSQLSADDFIFASPQPDKVSSVEFVIDPVPEQPPVTVAPEIPASGRDTPAMTLPLPEDSVPVLPDEPASISPVMVEPLPAVEVPPLRPIDTKPLPPIEIEPALPSIPDPVIPVRPEQPVSESIIDDETAVSVKNVLNIDKTFATVTLPNESQTINVNAAFATVVAGDGNNDVTVSNSFASMTLGGGNNTLTSSGSFLTLLTGDGDNRIELSGSSSDITLGEGNNVISGKVKSLKLGNGDNIVNATDSFMKLYSGDGNNQINSRGSFAEITVGNGYNSIVSSGFEAKITLGNGENNVVVSGMSSTVNVGQGINDVEFNCRSGSLVFASDINPENLWFQHQGEDLRISVIGSQQQVTLHHWYDSKPERPSTIVTGDHHSLSDRSVEQLVQAMAGFARPASATSWFSNPGSEALQPVLAASWR